MNLVQTCALAVLVVFLVVTVLMYCICRVLGEIDFNLSVQKKGHFAQPQLSKSKLETEPLSSLSVSTCSSQPSSSASWSESWREQPQKEDNSLKKKLLQRIFPQLFPSAAYPPAARGAARVSRRPRAFSLAHKFDKLSGQEVVPPFSPTAQRVSTKGGEADRTPSLDRLSGELVALSSPQAERLSSKVLAKGSFIHSVPPDPMSPVSRWVDV